MDIHVLVPNFYGPLLLTDWLAAGHLNFSLAMLKRFLSELSSIDSVEVWQRQHFLLRVSLHPAIQLPIIH